MTMMPFNASFRSLLRRFIPQLKSNDLDRHESLTARRHHLIQEIELCNMIVPGGAGIPAHLANLRTHLTPAKGGLLEGIIAAHPAIPAELTASIAAAITDAVARPNARTHRALESLLGDARDALPKADKNGFLAACDGVCIDFSGGKPEELEAVTESANSIFAPYRNQFIAAQRLWSARRRLALAQGNVQQIPASWKGLGGLVVAILVYWGQSISQTPTLVANRIRYLFGNVTLLQVLLVTATLGAAGYAGVQFDASTTNSPKQPVADRPDSQTREQKIQDIEQQINELKQAADKNIQQLRMLEESLRNLNATETTVKQ